VLSGFLITGILLDSKGKPGFYRNFYLRRARRILPVYSVVLLLLLILRSMSIRTALISLFFLANYIDGFHLTDAYWPLWSLSVEEQFYLVWPAIVGNISMRTLTRLVLLICLCEPFLRWLTFSFHLALGDIHLTTYLIADNLAFGALAAIFARSTYGTRRNAIRAGLVTCAIGVLFFLAGLPFGLLHRSNAFGAAFQTVPWDLLFAGALVLFLGLQSPFFTGPWTAPLRFLGYISYGLYLIHELINSFYSWAVGRISIVSVRILLQGAYTRLLLSSALAILIAWLSRRFYEEYFLRMNRKDTAPKVSHAEKSLVSLPYISTSTRSLLEEGE
jgi:peptidoglycan/LPS O-acetylase OafA/YrhL